MKISKRNLSMLIENLLLEDPNNDPLKINKFMEESKIELVKYYSSESYKNKISKSLLNKFSDKKVTNSLAQNLSADVVRKINESEYQIVPETSTPTLKFSAERGDYQERMKETPTVIIPKSLLTQEDVTDEMVKEVILHELSHIETQLRSDLETSFSTGSKRNTTLQFSNFIITEDDIQQLGELSRWEDKAYRSEYIDLFRRRLILTAPLSDQELSARLIQLRINSKGDTQNAIEYSRKNTFEDTIEEYGDFSTQFLFAIRTDIPASKVSAFIDQIASISKKSDSLPA